MKFGRIVLIDDSENDNFFHCMALQKANFQGEVRVFDRAIEGLNFLLQDPMTVPTCVLLDINMPGLDGFEVAESLASNMQQRANFKLLMLTSSNWIEDRRAAETIPLIEGFLIKPLTTSSAVELLNDAEAVV